MRKHSFIFLLSFFSLFISGQVNLVPNPSFENVSMCPSALTQISLAAPWFQAGTGTPDLFAACSTNTDVGVPVNLLGNQAPNTGDKYSGIELTGGDYREYIEIPLTNSLIAGTKYFVSFYASMDDTMAYTSSSIGAYFSTGSLSVSHYSPIPVVPQIQNAANNYFDQITWKKVKGSFYSSGGESYLTIGNFNSTANTNSMIVNTNTMVYNPCCAFVYIDDVCVTTDSLYSETWTSIETQELNKSKFIKLSPNPASNKLFIQRGNYINNLNITIYDLNMKLLLEVVNFKQNELDISSLPLGVYIIKIWNKDFLDKKLIIKSQ